jgi:hypothetical protein
MEVVMVVVMEAVMVTPAWGLEVDSALQVVVWVWVCHHWALVWATMG